MDKLRECPFCGSKAYRPDDEARVHCGACDAFGPYDENAAGEAWNHRAVPGKIIGMHWMEAALERMYAGEPELDVMRDYGYVTARPTETAPCNNCGGKKVWRLICTQCDKEF